MVYARSIYTSWVYKPIYNSGGTTLYRPIAQAWWIVTCIQVASPDRASWRSRAPHPLGSRAEKNLHLPDLGLHLALTPLFRRLDSEGVKFSISFQDFSEKTECDWMTNNRDTSIVADGWLLLHASGIGFVFSSRNYCGWLRNPAPVDRWFIQLFTGFQMVQDSQPSTVSFTSINT